MVKVKALFADIYGFEDRDESNIDETLEFLELIAL